MIDVNQAEEMILARMPTARIEQVPLAACVGRVLRATVVAERDQPPFDRVTMDGVAIAYCDWEAGTRQFQLAGTQGAGAAPLAVTASAQCIEVMTGAMLPLGADTVVPVERLLPRGASVEVGVDAAVTHGQFIHRQGSDHRAGEPLLDVGALIGPTEMAVLASAGAATVAVSALPRVAVISTGDELVDVDEPLRPWQIRSGNDRAIEASLLKHRLGTVTRGRLADDEHVLFEAIQDLHARNDVLILSGGVSMGQFDYVPTVLERLGAKLVFHKIRQRPGRPMWFGITAEGKPIFALPGNPVSALVCLTRYVLPALRQSIGLTLVAAERVALVDRVEVPADLACFIPVTLRWSDHAVMEGVPRRINTSGDFISLAGTDGIVELPPGRSSRETGEVARFFRW